MRPSIRILGIALAAALLGCGQKGPLVLPPPQGTPVSRPPATSPPATPAPPATTTPDSEPRAPR